MPSLQVSQNETAVDFTYTDSGAPGSDNYTTIIIIHGHTFHSGAFKHLLPLAPAQNMRIICVNRREYAGSTSYTEQELAAIQQGDEAERLAVFESQGVYLALLVDALIVSLSLPKDGGVALCGWSLGSLFLLSLLVSITSLPPDTKARLQAYVTTAILLEPPTQALGIKSPPDCSYLPLWDEELPPKARGPAFGKWTSCYFKHGDLSQRDYTLLTQRDPDPARKPTMDSLRLEELLSITDFVPGDKCETVLIDPAFWPVSSNMVHRALFDQTIRRQWTNLRQVWDWYGDSSTWNCIYQAWVLEERLHSASPVLKFKMTEGTAHFPFWDEPERSISILADMVKPPTWLQRWRDYFRLDSWFM